MARRQVQPKNDPGEPAMTPRARRRWMVPVVIGLVAIVLVAVALVVGRQRSVDSHAPPAENGATPLPSHGRMVATLREIYQRTESENHWLGDGAAEQARARLAALGPEGPAEERFGRLFEVAEHELRLGRNEQAIARFEEARTLASRLGTGVPERARTEAVFRLGIAYLRLGESQNCATQHNAESCIVPIRGAAIHTAPAGSEAAIRVFEEVLAATPTTSPLHLKTVWLLNLAAMTVGRHPHGIPERYRLPPAVYGSDAEFPEFPNVAPALGVDSFNLSGGAVVDDFDGDDWLDLLTTTFDARGEPHYFQNLGDGTFVDRTDPANLRGLYGGLNLVTADYDNDGDLDVYVLRGAWLYTAGRHPNSLLRNDGHGRFEDVTFDAGLGEQSFPTQTASWADYDNDGDLDLYVGNEHGDGSGEAAAPPAFDAPSQLFRNRGDGTFEEVAAAAGVQVRAFVKGVIWGDYDADRYPDLYVSVLGGPNHLFRNLGDGSFTEVTDQAGVAGPINSFPVWFWDYDNDGNLDLYVSSYRGSKDGVALVAASYLGVEVPYDLPRLYRGDGQGGFVDVAKEIGLGRLHLTMGSNFGDLDGDGFLDFYLGTGYPDYEAVMPNVLYRNVGGRRFDDVTLAARVGHLQKGHAVSFADYDNDGDLDLFAEMGGAFPGDRAADVLFQNPGFASHWLTLHLVGRGSNRSAIGARIRVDIVEGGARRSIHRVVSSGGSFGANPLRQTIGLGRATEVEQLEIYWPRTDTRHLLSNVPVDRLLRITEGAGFEVVVPKKRAKPAAMVANRP